MSNNGIDQSRDGCEEKRDAYIFRVLLMNGETHLMGVDELDATLTFNSFKVLNSEYLMGSYFGGLKPKSYIHILDKRYLDVVLKFLPGFGCLERLLKVYSDDVKFG
ncbi:alcohol dehydrogenase superfamily, zinc-type, GroES-like, NAD(P)-binding domain protein [Artemisia annua]|uniref:Alcohol dehydrogenase superfamily, zinc-type, GroES-like, NAD(P)-binding domain protein n=1 Tax=Artemisia annua TaxID=35608 RepID=A0A2U1P249_ARTAN|nr:alcohol dehydrogenase superfamily, zinc-type, GroES-like, NAD(P)-binding domain protein [Artemisia annua]